MAATWGHSRHACRTNKGHRTPSTAPSTPLGPPSASRRRSASSGAPPRPRCRTRRSLDESAGSSWAAQRDRG
eukprot:1188148-Prorocentrum_minimum.AAC.10